MTEPVFTFDGEDPRMVEAHKAAQKSFKYFWRELSWERRRIIPGLGVAMIKLPFTDGDRTDGNPPYEQMWCDDVGFDGEFLSGILANAPNWLTSVKVGDSVRVPFTHLSDWMMTSDGAAYGGHTVNLMRSSMDKAERKAHDQAWGLEFGDPDQVRTEVVRRTKKKQGFLSRLFGPKPIEEPVADSTAGFRDHPMCTNMLEKIETQLQEDPSIATSTDEHGWIQLHSEALAGNLGVCHLLLKYGAKLDAQTPDGKVAAALARSIGWDVVASSLSGPRG